jgi:hypothetical protein
VNAVAVVDHVYGSVNVAEAIALGLLAGVNVVRQPTVCKVVPSSSLPKKKLLSVYPPVNHRQLFAPPPEVRVAERLGAAGVTLLLAAVYAPVPIVLTAATRNIYAVPLVNPVTDTVVDVDAERVKVVHDDPELELY